MWEHAKKWWAVYGTVVIMVLTQLLPIVQSEVAIHPKLASVIAGVAVILAKVSKQPQLPVK